MNSGISLKKLQKLLMRMLVLLLVPTPVLTLKLV